VSIAELAARLSGNRLHVIVFGPGYGESIAVHVPDGGWLICDSLSGTGGAAGFIPAVELLGQRQEPAAMLLLTHPHDDHVAGFDRLVNRFASGPVGVVGLHLAREDFTEDDYATGVLATSNRLKALASINRYLARASRVQVAAHGGRDVAEAWPRSR
jgi:glyoxylase-like metal-dependent hydrolase (beta-lactamase superfamily II)